jgi:choline dehydrogenase-like flavoprotein
MRLSRPLPSWEFERRRHRATLKRMKRVRGALTIFTFAWLCAVRILPVGQASADSDQLQAVHNALFSTFLPMGELSRQPQTLALFLGVRDEIWAGAREAPSFIELLAPFADLRGFGRACGIDSYFPPDVAVSFADLTAEQRDHVMSGLELCDLNDARRIAMMARTFYVTKTYGLLQGQLADVNLTLDAPQRWVSAHRPDLRPSRLRYVRDRHEIDSTDKPIDYLIVGSGPAGSVLAHELRRGGKHVLLVERGSFVEPGAVQTRGNSEFIDTRTSDDGSVLISNGIAVGGGTEVNIDLCFSPTSPPIQAKIEDWRGRGLIGQREFNKAEVGRAYEWVRQAIGTRRLGQGEMNENNRVLWEGAQREGLHPQLYDLNTYAPGKSPYPVTDKRSSESQLLIEALEDSRNPLSMIPDAEVLRVVFEQRGEENQAIGVEIRFRAPAQGDGIIADPNGFRASTGEIAQIRAQNVILSAGALGSPTILLRSGVSNGRIGHGVILHPSMPIIGKFDRTIDALQGTEASVYVGDHLMDRGYAFEAMSAEPAYAALMSPGPAMHAFEMVRDFRHLAGFGVMLIDSVSFQNRLALDSSGQPRIYYQLSESDKARFREGIAEAVRVMFRAGANEVCLPTTESLLGSKQQREVQPIVLKDFRQADLVEKNLMFIPNRSILTSAHMQATDKMGDSPEDSVVADDFHVWGTKNLYVVDGSIFPTSIGANPMQSIYTFAKIFADRFNPTPSLSAGSEKE